MSADFWIVPPGSDSDDFELVDDSYELTVSTCPTCSMVLDGLGDDEIPYSVPFTFARLHGLHDDGQRSHHWNVTYNLSAMLQEAGFIGWSGAERDLVDTSAAARHFATVLQVLVSDPDHFRRMNPSNGWGNYFGLVATLSDFVKVAATHPYMKVGYWL